MRKKSNPLTTAILLIFFMLLMLLWTYTFYARIKIDRSAEVNMMENRRNIYQNSVQVAKIHSLFVPRNYHVAMVPMLVPGRTVYGPKLKNFGRRAR